MKRAPCAGFRPQRRALAAGDKARNAADIAQDPAQVCAARSGSEINGRYPPDSRRHAGLEWNCVLTNIMKTHAMPSRMGSQRGAGGVPSLREPFGGARAEVL